MIEAIGGDKTTSIPGTEDSVVGVVKPSDQSDTSAMLVILDPSKLLSHLMVSKLDVAAIENAVASPLATAD